MVDVRHARVFAGTVQELNDALLFVELEPGEQPRCGIWLSVYGAAPDPALQTALSALAARLFAEPAPV